MPQWVFGMATYTFLDAGTIFATYARDGMWHLATSPRVRRGDHNRVAVHRNRRSGCRQWFGCHGGRQPISADGDSSATIARSGEFETLKRSLDVAIDPGYLSLPTPISFPTANGSPPTPSSTRLQIRISSPRMVSCRPSWCRVTAGHRRHLDGAKSPDPVLDRGIAVLDVNYGGSTGYGRDIGSGSTEAGASSTSTTTSTARATWSSAATRTANGSPSAVERQRLHDPRLPGLPRRLQCRRQLLRHERPGGAR